MVTLRITFMTVVKINWMLNMAVQIGRGSSTGLGFCRCWAAGQFDLNPSVGDHYTCGNPTDWR